MFDLLIISIFLLIPLIYYNYRIWFRLEDFQASLIKKYGQHRSTRTIFKNLSSIILSRTYVWFIRFIFALALIINIVGLSAAATSILSGNK